MCKIKCCKQLHLSSFGEVRQYVSQALLQNTFCMYYFVYNQAFLKAYLVMYRAKSVNVQSELITIKIRKNKIFDWSVFFSFLISAKVVIL